MSTREWAVWLATAAIVFLVALEADQRPIAVVAAALGVLSIFGLLWRLLAVPSTPGQFPQR